MALFETQIIMYNIIGTTEERNIVPFGTDFVVHICSSPFISFSGRIFFGQKYVYKLCITLLILLFLYFQLEGLHTQPCGYIRIIL